MVTYMPENEASLVSGFHWFLESMCQLACQMVQHVGLSSGLFAHAADHHHRVLIAFQYQLIEPEGNKLCQLTQVAEVTDVLAHAIFQDHKGFILGTGNLQGHQANEFAQQPRQQIHQLAKMSDSDLTKLALRSKQSETAQNSWEKGRLTLDVPGSLQGGRAGVSKAPPKKNRNGNCMQQCEVVNNNL